MPPFPLLDHQKKLLAIAKKTPAPGRHAAHSAVAHLRAAWRIRKIDPAMAVFRGITADEESVTAIFQALKHRKYEGADALQIRSHIHKAAAVPFLAAVERALVGLTTFSPQVVLKRPEVRPPRIRLQLRFVGIDGIDYVAEPEPPLHGALTHDGAKVNFSAELAAVASAQQTRTILGHIRDLANERNRLLYASPSGVPNVTGLKDEFFLRARRRVFRNIGIYLFIIEYREHQDFVQQALDAFWTVFDRVSTADQADPAPAV